jgi:hypothetical protein
MALALRAAFGVRVSSPANAVRFRGNDDREVRLSLAAPSGLFRDVLRWRGRPGFAKKAHRRRAPGEAIAMNRIATSLITASLALGVAPLLLSTPVRADTLQTQTVHSVPLRVKVQKEQRYNLPKRGMTMDQVKREYGAPEKVLATRGGSSKQQPPIHRWEYPKYIVYFEYSHVIHSVLRTPGPHSL